MTRASALLALLTLGLVAAAPGELRAAEDAEPKMTLCTGGKDGVYYAVGVEFKNQNQGFVEVEPINTKGSIDNLKRMAAGECDAAIVQSDAHRVFTADNPSAKLNIDRAATLYPEYVHLICPRELDIDDIGEIEDKPDDYLVYIGPNGSGTQTTWAGFILQDDDYAKIPTQPLGGKRALLKVSDPANKACMLYVAGLGSAFMQGVAQDMGDRVELVEIDDSDFNDAKDQQGNRIYQFEDIDEKVYPELMKSDIETLVVDAVVVVSTDWIDAHEEAYEEFLTTVIRVQNSLRAGRS